MSQYNIMNVTASLNRLVFVVIVALLTTACVEVPLYIEPVGEKTATLVINNKTLDTEMFSFSIYEDSKGCIGRTDYKPDVISRGPDKSIRKQVSLKIPARKGFSFNIGTYLGGTSRRCSMFASFDARQGHKYIITLKNRGFCSVKLAEELEGGHELIPVELLRPRLNEYGIMLACE